MKNKNIIKKLISTFTTSGDTFKAQRPGEETVLVARKHLITLFAPISTLMLLALLPFVIYFFISLIRWYPIISSLYWFLVAVYFLTLWNLAFYNIIIYLLNTIVVTNERVIETEQRGFFKYTTSEIELDKIQDISVKVFGTLAEFLDFGDVELQSAGTLTKFYFDKLPHPHKIKKVIMSLKKDNSYRPR